MANIVWNNIDKYSYKFEEKYCAFLDILGYKNRAHQFFNHEYNLYERIDRAFININDINTITENLIDKSERSLEIFSDSIIITYPITDNTLFALLHDVKTIVAHLSMDGLFIRGGISKGKHFQENTKESNFKFLASEALQEAFALEQDEEKKPRVLIDKKLIQKLNADTIADIIKEDNKYFVHFASLLINGNKDFQAVIKEMKDIQKNLNNPDKGVQEKYQWLLNYYYWTILQDGCYPIEEFNKFTTLNIDEIKFKAISLNVKL